jgi:hypothetical protein
MQLPILEKELQCMILDFGNVGPAVAYNALHSPNSTSVTYNLYAKTLNASSLFRPKVLAQ